MAFNNQSLQQNKEKEIQNENMLGKSDYNGQSEIEVRPEKSMTFNLVKQSLPKYSANPQQQNQSPNKQNEDDQKKDNKLKDYDKDQNKNALSYSPLFQNKNNSDSPKQDDLNLFSYRQELATNLFTNQISDVPNLLKRNKGGNDVIPTDQGVYDQINTKLKSTKPIAKMSSLELNKIIENNTIQSSQVNVQLNQNGNGIYQSNFQDNYSSYNYMSSPLQNYKLPNPNHQRISEQNKAAYFLNSNNFENQIIHQISEEYNSNIALDSFQKSPNISNQNRNSNPSNKNEFKEELEINSQIRLKSPDQNISQNKQNAKQEQNVPDFQLQFKPTQQLKEQGKIIKDTVLDLNNNNHVNNNYSNNNNNYSNNNNHNHNNINNNNNHNPIHNISYNTSLQRLRIGELTLHLHKLLKGKANLSAKETWKIILLQVLGILVEAIQLIQRGFQKSNKLFSILAPISMVIQIISIVPIIVYLQNIRTQVYQSHKIKLTFFGFSQIVRILIFLNTFLLCNKNISSVEVISEIYFILLLTRQVLLNFPLFRQKSKIRLLEAFIFFLGGIFMIDYDDDNVYFQFLQWIIMIVMIFFTQFYFKGFPYNICGMYNAQDDSYFQMKRSYFSQKILESQLNDQLGIIPTSKNMTATLHQNNANSGGKVNNNNNVVTAVNSQIPNDMWVLEHKNPNENNVQYVNAINKHDAKNMLSEAYQFVLLNSSIKTIHVSKKMSSYIQNNFIKKDWSMNGKSQPGQQVQSPNSQQSQQQSQQNPSTPQKEQQQSQQSQQQQQSQPQQQKFEKISYESILQKFDQFLEKIIIERVDSETMTLWESQRKMNNRPSYFMPNSFNDSGSQSLPNYRNRLAPNTIDNHQSQQMTLQPLQFSQFNNPLPLNPSTFKDIIQIRNSMSNTNKVSASAITTNNIGFSSRIGLKSKNIMIPLKEFLSNLSNNWVFFKQHFENKPIVVASFTTEEQSLNLQELKKYQIKIYPQTKKIEQGEELQSQNDTVQSVVGITTSKKFIQENENEQKDCPINYLIVFEEVHSREKIVNKYQFYQFLKSLFRCFNNDLTQSLGNILGTSQAGIQSKQVKEEVKDNFIRPILLSCRIIKYILHNLRDFNDLVGERFQLHIIETSIPKVAEDSVILFKATSDKQISFKVVISSEVPIVISTDQRRLVQIIITLLSNAHKHTQAGSLVFRIFHPFYKGVLNRNHLRFQVEDTGEGMDDSVQMKLSKIFNSGIGYQDFKTISTFGFNLFICNIIAKKLFNPEYQYSVPRDREYSSEPISDAGGIKFKSVQNKGSLFYFDIKLIDEKKQDKLQDSVFNYLHGTNIVPTVSELHSMKYNPSVKSHIIISNSQNPTNPSPNNNSIEKEFMHPINASKFNAKTGHKNSANLAQVDGSDIADEVKTEMNKIDMRIMTFQKQPKGLHSDYKFLKCQCKNVLIIDKVLRNLESLEILLTNTNFQPQKCCSMKEAISFCEEKKGNQCLICNQTTFICIFFCVDEFQKQDMTILAKEFESFTNSPYCSESIIILVGNSSSKTRKLLENARIDDELAYPFDSYELNYLINSWKLLPISDSYYNQSTIKNNVSQSN